MFEKILSVKFLRNSVDIYMHLSCAELEPVRTQNRVYLWHMSDSSIYQSLKELHILSTHETNSEIIARVEKRLRTARQTTASR